MAGSIYTAVAGWAVIGGIGFYIWLMSHQRKQRATRRGMPMRPAEKAIEAQKEPKSRKSRKDGGQSGGELGKGAIKRTEKRIEPVREVETSTAVAKDTDKDAEIEFARQLSNAKTGTLLASKPQVGARQKTQKQKRAQEKPAIVETSSDNDNGTAPSSAAGGDDEHTPSSSPEMSATTKGDDPVADMLQPASPGASVLRITESTKPSQPKKDNRPQTYEPVETKKQRQNRKKAEAKKLALQEEEKERKILMEKQRRTAREAEGRAAKDGSTFMASKAPSTSAWTPSSSTANKHESTNSKVELLDTYEPSSSKVTPAPAPVYSESQEMGDLYPEEKQFFDRQLYEDSNWQTVKEKKSRKGKKPGVEQDVKEKQETGTKQAAPLQQEDFGHPPVTAPSKPGDSWDTTVVHVEPNGEVKEYDRVVQDSEWEVS